MSNAKIICNFMKYDRLNNLSCYCLLYNADVDTLLIERLDNYQTSDISNLKTIRQVQIEMTQDFLGLFAKNTDMIYDVKFETSTQILIVGEEYNVQLLEKKFCTIKDTYVDKNLIYIKDL